MLGSLAMVPYFLIDDPLAAGIYWDVAILAVLVTGAHGAMRTLRRPLPWLMVLAGQLMFLVGDASWIVLEHVVHSDRYPNIGDAFYLGGYLPITAGLLMMLHRQRRGRDVAVLIDGLTVALSAGVLLWVFFIGPAMLDGSVGLAERIVNTAYPSVDLLLVAIGAQLAVRIHRSASTWALAVGLGTLLAADIWYAYLVGGDAYTDGHPVDALWWLSYVVIAALAASPLADELSNQPDGVRPARLSPARLATVVVVTMASPLTIAIRAATHRSLELGALLGGSIVLFSLVVARMAVIARQLDDSRGQLLHDATHDALTGLGNRTLYGERVRQVLEPAAGMPRRVAVLCIDLDDFKSVNDSLGHAAGDRLLQTVGERLRLVVRRHDSVARLSGDEFAIVVDEEPAETALDIAERVLAEIAKPVVLGDDATTYPSASIGVAFGEAGQSVDDLLRDADIAMYAAKSNGKGRWEVYRPGMHQQAMERFELRGDLGLALERDQLTLHYQPIVTLATGEFCGFEALVRWMHPVRGRIDPGRFIGLAEETGLIVPFGRWILERACAQAMAISDDPDGPYMSVNVSAVQLRSTQLIRDVEAALASSGLAPQRLLLELTESAMIDDYDKAARLLGDLRRLGVRIALDDFGAGYSSLRQLRSFEVDVVKLDQSLLRATMANDVSVLTGLVAMADSLGLQTVGEGIEELDQLDLLRDVHCHFAQGFLFSHPLPADELERMLASR